MSWAVCLAKHHILTIFFKISLEGNLSQLVPFLYGLTSNSGFAHNDTVLLKGKHMMEVWN